MRSRSLRAARIVTAIGFVATFHATAVVTLVAAPRAAWAQKAALPVQKLIDQAKERFDEQQYDESIQKLSAALLRRDATREQKIEIYRWLAYNYVVLRQEDSARTALYALFALDEDYELPKTESPKFREPFGRYKQQWIEEGRPGVEKVEKAPAPVVLRHAPETQVPQGRSIAISGSFDDPDRRVAKVALFFRSGSSGKFLEIPAKLALKTFQATIPGAAVKPPLVEYYVQASDEGGLAIASRGDAETPLRVAVQDDSSGSVFGKWWFWTGAGAVVAGGVAAAFLLSRSSGNGTGPGPGPSPTSNVTITIRE
jgi:hypothetical protein